MGDNNEKTFSDLFSNIKSDNDTSDNNVTFDSLSSNIDDNKIVEENTNEGFSFNNLFDIANKDTISTNEVENNNLNDVENENFNKIVDKNSKIDNFVDMVTLDDVRKEENVHQDIIEENDNINDEISFDNFKVAVDAEETKLVNDEEQSNLEFSNDEELDKVEANSNSLDASNDFQIKDDITELDNIDNVENKIGQETLSYTINEDDSNISNNLDNEKNINVDNLSNNSNDIEENIDLEEEVSSNVFGIGEDVQVDNNKVVDDNEFVEITPNIFGIGNDVDEKNITFDTSNEKDDISIKQVIKDTKDISNEKVKNSEFASPFFDSQDGFSNDKLEALVGGVISLDETASSKKEIDKLDLDGIKNFNVKVVPKKEPLIKFIVGVISYAFFIWLLLIGITLLVYVLDIKIRAAKGDYSSPTFNAYVVLTGSMLPEIEVNDVVVTKKIDAKDLEVGDIITFASADSRFSGTIITHRIIKKNPGTGKGGMTFQTKGDNNNVADSTLVPESNIYGKVILKIPKLGYLQEFLASDGGWIIVILIPCLTVISYDIVKLIKGLRYRKYNNIKVKK